MSLLWCLATAPSDCPALSPHPPRCLLLNVCGASAARNKKKKKIKKATKKHKQKRKKATKKGRKKHTEEIKKKKRKKKKDINWHQLTFLYFFAEFSFL